MLEKPLGLGLATALVAGNMIGSGIYLLPVTLAATGSMTIVGWVIAAAGALLLAAVFARVAVLCLSPGRTLADAVRDRFGPFAAYVWSLLYWLCAFIGNIAVALAVVGYAAWFVPALARPALSVAATIAVLWLLTLANLYGARVVTQIEALTLVVGLLPVLAVAIFGWWWFSPNIFAGSWNVSGLSAWSAIPASLVLIFWAFTGLESAAMASAVVANPARDIPIATVGGTAIAALVYIAACTVLSGITPAAEMATQTAPFASAVGKALGAGTVGGIAAGLVALCAMFKSAGTLGGWLLVTAETARTGARAGLFPRHLAEDIGRVPRRALLVMAALLTVLTLATASPTLGRQFGVLINVSVLFCLFAYLGVCALLWRIGRPGDRILAAAMFVYTAGVCLASDPLLLGISTGIAVAVAASWLIVGPRLAARVAPELQAARSTARNASP